MATVTLAAEIAAQIIGQQCDYNSTTPHFNMHIKFVTSTCSLPSAMKKVQLLTHWLDSVPEFSVFHFHVDCGSLQPGIPCLASSLDMQHGSSLVIGTPGSLSHRRHGAKWYLHQSSSGPASLGCHIPRGDSGLILIINYPTGFMLDPDLWPQIDQKYVTGFFKGCFLRCSSSKRKVPRKAESHK